MGKLDALMDRYSEARHGGTATPQESLERALQEWDGMNRLVAAALGMLLAGLYFTTTIGEDEGEERPPDEALRIILCEGFFFCVKDIASRCDDRRLAEEARSQAIDVATRIFGKTIVARTMSSSPEQFQKAWDALMGIPAASS